MEFSEYDKRALEWASMNEEYMRLDTNPFSSNNNVCGFFYWARAKRLIYIETLPIEEQNRMLQADHALALRMNS
jgi:hypothetical protein